MKKNLLYILLLLVAACQVIPEDERVTDVSKESGSSSVLLTEFTAVGCVNCPLAAAEAQNLKQAYTDRLLVVAMHPASNPFTQATEQYDYTCAAADEYYKYFGGEKTTPLPTGIVDFRQTESGYFTDYKLWGGEVLKQLQQKQPYELSVSQTVDAASREAHITVSNADRHNNIMLWLVEDSIVGAQQMPDGKFNLNYVHNHILREAISEVWGSSQTEYTYIVPPKYDLNHCSVVAVELDADKVVLAAAVSRLQAVSDMQMLLSVDGVGQIKNDTTITISVSEQNPLTGKVQMGVTGSLVCKGQFYVTIEREDTAVQDQFCCADKCVNTNEEKRQQMSFTSDGISSWYTHLYPTEEKIYTVTYIFNSESKQPIRLTIKYNYKQNQ